MVWVFSLPPSLDTSRYLKHYFVDKAYTSFKHVIRVVNDEGLWTGGKPAELEDWCYQFSSYYFWDRVWFNQWRNRWESNGIGGGDYFFIVTDYDDSAILAKLRWS